MRASIFTTLLLFFTLRLVTAASLEHRAVVTYYDRNGDGVADYELHHVPGSVSRSYALIDEKFTGRYSEKMGLAYPYRMDRVDIPVSRKVKLIRGMPPVIADQRTMPPTPAR